MSVPTPPVELTQPQQKKEPEQTQEITPAPKQELAQWSRENLDLLKRTIAKDLTNEEFMLFAEVCKRRRLDPFAKQIYAVKRDGRMVLQTSIDGYRLIAERTGRYLGQTAPEWCGQDGKWTDIWTKPENPFACRVGVFRQGHAVPTIGVAYWSTYVAPGPFWKKAGPHMVAKCAEALALKKAFPEELSGLYTNDEMEQSSIDTIVTNENAPLVAEEVQPVMVFPEAVLASNSSGVLVKDNKGLEWVFPTVIGVGAEVDAAVSANAFLLVYYTVESGRRIVTGLGGV